MASQTKSNSATYGTDRRYFSPDIFRLFLTGSSDEVFSLTGNLLDLKPSSKKAIEHTEDHSIQKQTSPAKPSSRNDMFVTVESISTDFGYSMNRFIYDNEISHPYYEQSTVKKSIAARTQRIKSILVSLEAKIDQR